jgi:DNA polymerase-3 subunit epsilon
LEASGDYRVLRRLKPPPAIEPPAGVPTRTGLFVDVETTGLDPASDEIIELAMVPFVYGLDGTIYSIGAAFHGLRQPSRPIPLEITAITGLDDAAVAGQTIDKGAVAAFSASAALVVAHNAAFDRRFLERFSDVFSTKAWACSMSQVDWASEGFEGVKLAYLVAHAGFFYDRHRATHDCLAAVTLLSRPLQVGGKPTLAQLLDRARAPTWRIWAENSPFDLKDVLKARGYRWNGDGKVTPRAWYIDVPDERRESELAFLRSEIYRGDIDLLVRRIDAQDRFSDRV